MDHELKLEPSQRMVTVCKSCAPCTFTTSHIVKHSNCGLHWTCQVFPGIKVWPTLKEPPESGDVVKIIIVRMCEEHLTVDTRMWKRPRKKVYCGSTAAILILHSTIALSFPHSYVEYF